MFDHLHEDWPWIVLPIVVVTLLALATLYVLGGDDGALFTYAV